MAVLKIEMPINCWDCEISYNNMEYEEGDNIRDGDLVCAKIRDIVPDYTECRAPFCPLE